MNQKGFAGIYILVGIIIVVILGGVYYFGVGKISVPFKNNPKACTQEAKQCPDGSYVGRTGPNCEFKECSAFSPSSFSDETANWKTYTNNFFNFSFKYPPYLSYSSSGSDSGNAGYITFERDGKEFFVLNLSDNFAPQGFGNYMGSKPLSKRIIGGKEWNYYNFSYQDQQLKELTYNIIAFEILYNNFLYSFVFSNQTELTPEQDQILSTFRFLDQSKQAVSSSGITLEAARVIIPLEPAKITVEKIGNVIKLKWSGTGGGGYYQIYRKLSKEDKWVKLAKVELIGDNRGWYEFMDTTARKNESYIYGASIIDSLGTESKITEGIPSP